MIRQILDMDQLIAQFFPVLFQAGLGFLRAEIIENDMLDFYRRSSNCPRGIQRGFDCVFYGSND